MAEIVLQENCLLIIESEKKVHREEDSVVLQAIPYDMICSIQYKQGSSHPDTFIRISLPSGNVVTETVENPPAIEDVFKKIKEYKCSYSVLTPVQ